MMAERITNKKKYDDVIQFNQSLQTDADGNKSKLVVVVKYFYSKINEWSLGLRSISLQKSCPTKIQIDFNILNK